LLDLFSTTGKGGKIEIADEPVFSLKTTIDYALSLYGVQKCKIFKVLQTGANYKSLSVKPLQTENEQNVEVMVEGKFFNG